MLISLQRSTGELRTDPHRIGVKVCARLLIVFKRGNLALSEPSVAIILNFCEYGK